MTTFMMVWTLSFNGVESGAFQLHYPTQVQCLAARKELIRQQGFEDNSKRHVCLRQYLPQGAVK